MSDLQAMPTAPDLHHQLFTDSPAATSPPPPLQIKYVELYTDKTSFAACSATVTTDPTILYNRLYCPLTPSHVAGITVQECGLARPARYYVTAASPSHYAFLNIDGSSQNWLCDFLTGAAILYGNS
ncbi:hypothetical protein F2Q70_00016931 [Brassica cretica]|uniref:Uncharacterized protein n=1 Tax=Brassica cretica TaxID=69181 RepID=A0A8S9HYE3_BRACR|nr:hypothetical protein F2Q70_00016931 [Brassica cretica]KAF2597836.1 hypothetical protein F2Q68_00009896 [Brassica cretica]